MEGGQAKTVSRVISCTAENAGEFRAVVQRWPELNALVRSLQSQGLFPGLRSMRIRVTGSPETLAKGLGAVCAENAPEGLA